MRSPLSFRVERTIPGKPGRAGVIMTPHGPIQTPAFVTVGTQATVKALTTDQVRASGSQIVLANTYHLYLQPGHEIIKTLGGLHRFMNWGGPMMTDSGGFQAFSLGAAFGHRVSKFGTDTTETEIIEPGEGALATVDDEGVTFRSHRDGSLHRFTPERSIDIQHALGADIIVAFDECTAPHANRAYQEAALERTRVWAERCVAEHRRAPAHAEKQALYGVVQGGRHTDLRERGAKHMASLPFDGYAIGGSFTKDDLGAPVTAAVSLLPEERPRHLLGIGEPRDLVIGIENGCDTFDCVLPTRAGRTGTLYTTEGRMNARNARFREDPGPLDPSCRCDTCSHYSRAYLHHLFKAHEMLAATLASVHNLYFMNSLTTSLRRAILDDTFDTVAERILNKYA